MILSQLQLSSVAGQDFLPSVAALMWTRRKVSWMSLTVIYLCLTEYPMSGEVFVAQPESPWAGQISRYIFPRPPAAGRRATYHYLSDLWEIHQVQGTRLIVVDVATYPVSARFDIGLMGNPEDLDGVPLSIFTLIHGLNSKFKGYKSD